MQRKSAVLMNMELGSPPPQIEIGNIVAHCEIPLVATFADILKGVYQTTVFHIPPCIDEAKVFRLRIQGS